MFWRFKRINTVRVNMFVQVNNNVWHYRWSRPELLEFEGISMNHCFTDDWEDVKNFQTQPDDVLIATYPEASRDINEFW